MIEHLEKAASLSVPEAAALLARVAARARPMTKSADPALWRNLAIGAGVGAGGMGLLGALRGKRRRSVARDALLGAGLGAGGVGLAYGLPEVAKAWSRPTATPGEQLARWDDKLPITKAIQRAIGAVPEGAPEGNPLGELAGPAGDAVLGAGSGIGRDLISSRATAGLATAGNLAYDANRALLQHRMKPVAETHAGLLKILEGEKDTARQAAMGAAVGRIEKAFGRPGVLSGLRPSVGYGWRAYNAAPSSFVGSESARRLGEKLLGDDKAMAGSRFGPIFRGSAGRAGRYAAPWILRAAIGR